MKTLKMFKSQLILLTSTMLLMLLTSCEKDSNQFTMSININSIGTLSPSTTLIYNDENGDEKTVSLTSNSWQKEFVVYTGHEINFRLHGECTNGEINYEISYTNHDGTKIHTDEKSCKESTCDFDFEINETVKLR